METAAQRGPSGDSTEDGLEMVTHTQQQVATGAWVEQAGMMTVSLRSILCAGDSSLWGRKGVLFFLVGFVCMCVFQCPLCHCDCAVGTVRSYNETIH